MREPLPTLGSAAPLPGLSLRVGGVPFLEPKLPALEANDFHNFKFHTLRARAVPIPVTSLTRPHIGPGAQELLHK